MIVTVVQGGEAETYKSIREVAFVEDFYIELRVHRGAGGGVTTYHIPSKNVQYLDVNGKRLVGVS